MLNDTAKNMQIIICQAIDSGNYYAASGCVASVDAVVGGNYRRFTAGYFGYSAFQSLVTMRYVYRSV